MGGVLYFTFLIFVMSEQIEKMYARECQTGCSVFLTGRLIVTLGYLGELLKLRSRRNWMTVCYHPH